LSSAIEFYNVSKKYLLHHHRFIGLRETIPYVMQQLFRGKKDFIRNAHTFFALRDCSFEIKAGDAVGIIGHNGAGKTTILKLIARITVPTRGVIKTQGKISALIEIGAGFHGDLTGRENIYLYGAILGLKRAEIRRYFAEIVEFSDLQKFIDMPVKHYSSGMYARLGFSVAAHLNHDILLVDEVLAVGDITFRQKCHQMMSGAKRQGKTIVFVSHSMPAVEGLCNKTIWLENGQIRMYDRTPSVIRNYLNHLNQPISQQLPVQSGSSNSIVQITGVKYFDSQGVEVDAITTNDFLTIEINYHTSREIYDPEFGISFLTEDGNRVATLGSSWDVNPCASIIGEGKIQCHIRSLPLLPRRYVIDITVYDGRGLTPFVEHYKAKPLTVEIAENLYARKVLTELAGIVYLDAKWSVSDPDLFESCIQSYYYDFQKT